MRQRKREICEGFRYWFHAIAAHQAFLNLFRFIAGGWGFAQLTGTLGKIQIYQNLCFSLNVLSQNYLVNGLLHSIHTIQILNEEPGDEEVKKWINVC